MSLGYKVYGAFPQGLLVQALCQDAATSISAAGATQGTATELTNAVSGITTVASNAGVILSSQSSAGDFQVVFNAGANSLKIYPDTGAKINQLAVNIAMSLATNTGCVLFKVSTTQWVGILSA